MCAKKYLLILQTPNSIDYMDQEIMYDSKGQPYNQQTEEREKAFDEIQKWLISMVASTNDKIKNELLGNTWIESETEMGWRRDPMKARLVSREGVSKIFALVEEYTNPSVLLGNLKKEQQTEIVNDFGFDIIDMVGDYYESWGINADDRRAIVNALVNYVWMISTRPTGGLDRTWFDKINMTVTKLQKQETDNKLGIIPMPFGNR